MRVLFLLLLLLLCTIGPARAMPPEVLDQMTAGDNPAQTAKTIQQRIVLAAGNDDAQFWWSIAAARVSIRLERHADALRHAAAAAALMDRLRPVGDERRLWLELIQLDAQAGAPERAALLPRVVSLRRQADGLGQTQVACGARDLETWLLMDLRSDDEAWLSAEAMERCGQLLRSPATKSSAQLAFAQLSRNRVTDGVKTSQPERHLAQAVAELGDEPARFLRSLIEWESSLLLRAQNRLEPALQHLRRARALSQELDDGAGVAAADLEHAAVLLDMNRPDEMLPLLDEAERLLVVGGEGDGAFRMPRLMELRVRALTRLRSPDLPAVLTQADRWIDTKTPSRHQAELENAMAEALAAIGRPGSAYEMLRRSMKTDQQMRGLARDSEMQHLQVRYELARRDAENTQLRMNSESARLQLEADRGRLQTLTAGLVALGALSVLGFSVASRELTRRRRLADLAMRDELTGQPNRRAVQAYAREQLAQAERLGLPFTLAVVDLDHFKQVNDRFGHAAGDAVLRAFAQVAGAVMRGQDRFGRWGGEEWLLVMPGTRLEEAASVFERLRERFAATPMPGAPADARCTFSMGAAELEPGVASVEALVAAADAALYRAKESGRNRLATSPLAVAAA